MINLKIIVIKNIRVLVLVFGTMFLSTGAIAGGAVGMTAAVTGVDASGYEQLKTSGNKTTHSTSETVAVPSLWIEFTNDDNGITVGLDFIPASAEVGSGSNTGDDDAETSGTNTVTADFKNHITLYAEKTIGSSGFYIKGGLSQVTLETDDSVSTGAKYGDESLSAYRLGLGVKRDLGTSGIFKLELEYADYDSATFKSTGSDAVTTVELENLDTTALRFSVGKKF